MPINVSRPGVYIQEIPPQPPMADASTSIAAFVGRTPIGPVNVPIPVNGYSDCIRIFGDLDQASAISYQASAFLNNGGRQALVVRLFRAPTATRVLVRGDPENNYVYGIGFEVNGAMVTVSFKASSGTAADVAAGLAAAVNADATLKAIVSASVPPGSNATVDLSILSNSTSPTGPPALQSGAPAAVQLVSSSIVDSDNGNAPVPATKTRLQFEPPLTIGAGLAGQDSAYADFDGAAATPLATGVTAFVARFSNAVTYRLRFTPVGGAPVEIGYKALPGDSTATDIAIGLYNAIKADAVASTLVDVGAGVPTGASLDIRYKKAMQIDQRVDGGNADDLSLAAMPVQAGTGVLTFAAANGGIWGNGLVVMLSAVATSQSSLYAHYGLSGSPTQKLFDLDVSYFDGHSYQTERFVNVTFAGDDKQPNRIDRILAESSNYLRYTNVPSNQALDGPSLGASVMVGFGAGGVDSAPLQVSDYTGDSSRMTGLYALDQQPRGFNILCVPSDTPDDPAIDQDIAVYQAAAQICVDNDAMLIIDPPNSWLQSFKQGNVSAIRIEDLGSFTAEQARSSAVYFPGVIISDPLANGRPRSLPPCGFMAAVWAATDLELGVWKAPAGVNTPIGGIISLQADLNDEQNGLLNQQGINVLRSFRSIGNVAWGARTVRGSDLLTDEYKYLSVRRLALFIRTSLLGSTQWAAMQPNGPALWTQLQAQVSGLMSGLYSQGAFAGSSQREAYMVKCDATTTSPDDRAAGIVNITVGFAPIRPAEFILINISQQTGNRA